MLALCGQKWMFCGTKPQNRHFATAQSLYHFKQDPGVVISVQINLVLIFYDYWLDIVTPGEPNRKKGDTPVIPWQKCHFHCCWRHGGGGAVEDFSKDVIPLIPVIYMLRELDLITFFWQKSGQKDQIYLKFMRFERLILLSPKQANPFLIFVIEFWWNWMKF